MPRKALPKIKRTKQDRDSAEDFSLIMRSRRVLKAWRKNVSRCSLAGSYHKNDTVSDKLRGVKLFTPQARECVNYSHPSLGAIPLELNKPGIQRTDLFGIPIAPRLN